MMKTRKVSAILLSVCLLFTLAACGSTPLSGKYVIVDIKDDPDGVTFADLDAVYKEADENIEDHMYIEFAPGNSFTFVMFGDAEKSGTYTRKNSTLTLIDGRETMTAEISGKKITLTYENGAKPVFEKKSTGNAAAAI